MTQNDLDTLIKGDLFEHYSQPILDINTNKKLGVELLLRTQLGSPEIIFRQAKKINRLYELDVSSIHKALLSQKKQDYMKEEMLFINVFPSTVTNPSFPSFLYNILAENEVSCQRVVFEINESDIIADIQGLKEKISFLKQLGFLIAIDDVGKGWSDLNKMVELETDFIKLDRYFSANLNKSKKKQNMISATLFYCHLNNIKMILEGIETQEDLVTAKNIGITLAQGFHLGRPEKIRSNKIVNF